MQIYIFTSMIRLNTSVIVMHTHNMQPCAGTCYSTQGKGSPRKIRSTSTPVHVIGVQVALLSICRNCPPGQRLDPCGSFPAILSWENSLLKCKYAVIASLPPSGKVL